jgi:hypothetical protein
MQQRFKSAAIRLILCGAISGISTFPLLAQTAARVEKHVVVYQQSGRFAGWPANHGAWSWGNEILVGFETGVHKIHKKGSGHAVDWEKPAKHVLARSLDSGETWTIEEPEGLRPPRGTKTSPPVLGGNRELTDCPGGIDFSNPDFVLTARLTSVHAGQSRFYYSLDRGGTWAGPYRIPNFGQPGTAARTDYLINGKHDLTMFLTAAKSNAREGRVICVRTRDGAKTWQMQSFVGPEPEGDEYAIMPSSIRLPGGRILTAIRYGRGFIDLYSSDDDGKSWSLQSRPASEIGDNPASMILLKDGRVVITYGYRRKPYGIRARLSENGGKSWGEEIVLRADGGNEDLGYPRTLLRPDGKLVTVYYYNLHTDTERFIGATMWDPGKSQ